MKKIVTFLFIGIFIIIVLKSCILTGISIDDYIILENLDKEGQLDRVVLTPKDEMIYTKNFQNIFEVGIYEIKGQEATHYISGIYCIGTFPFGLRYYHNAEKVFDAELKLTKKQGESFPGIGDAYRAKIIIFKEEAKIGNHSYKRITINQDLREKTESMINQLKTNIN